jgi:hypothetical protein
MNEVGNQQNYTSKDRSGNTHGASLSIKITNWPFYRDGGSML